MQRRIRSSVLAIKANDQLTVTFDLEQAQSIAYVRIIREPNPERIATVRKETVT